MLISYSKHAQKVLSIASRRAEAVPSPHVGREHIALALLDYAKGFVADFLLDIKIPIAEIYEDFHTIAKEASNVSEQDEVSFLDKLESIASRYEADYIGTEHILIALIEDSYPPLLKYLKQTPFELKDIVAYLGGDQDSLMFEDEDQLVPVGGGGSIVSKDSSVLVTYGTNLTERYLEQQGDPIIGRNDEINRAIKILCRKTKNNPLLIGDAGVGKTAIAEGIAQRIAMGQVPFELQGVQIIVIDIFAMLGGTMYRGQFEDKIINLIREVKEYFGKVVLFIDEIHNIVGAGAGNSEDSGDMSNILKPALSRGEISCIGATTINEYRKYIEKDAALERRFQRVLVEEPSLEDTFKILKGIRNSYCEYHNVKISDEVLRYIIKKCSDMCDRRFPDKAIDLLDESCVESHLSACRKIPNDLILREKEIDRLLVNAIQSDRHGEDDYFIGKKMDIINEGERRTCGRVSKRDVDTVLENRGNDPIAKQLIGFSK